MRILLIDGDARSKLRLEQVTQAEGYHLCQELAYPSGERRAAQEEFDAVVLGIDAPDQTGLGLCRRLRAAARARPILVLTSDPEPRARVRSFEAGADFVFPRDFDSREFIVRLRRLFPGAPRDGPSRLCFEDLEMDLPRRRVARNGRPITLTHQEFALLEEFIRRPDVVLSQTELGERVWNLDHGDVRKLVKAYVWRLRQKIDKASPNKLIRTVRGFGYMMTAAQRRDPGLPASPHSVPTSPNPVPAYQH
jgi:DNA-binding response OmpR family regulator